MSPGAEKPVIIINYAAVAKARARGRSREGEEELTLGRRGRGRVSEIERLRRRDSQFRLSIRRTARYIDIENPAAGTDRQAEINSDTIRTWIKRLRGGAGEFTSRAARALVNQDSRPPRWSIRAASGFLFAKVSLFAKNSTLSKNIRGGRTYFKPDERYAVATLATWRSQREINYRRVLAG